jgi:hypothetical protein
MSEAAEVYLANDGRSAEADADVRMLALLLHVGKDLIPIRPAVPYPDVLETVGRLHVGHGLDLSGRLPDTSSLVRPRRVAVRGRMVLYLDVRVEHQGVQLGSLE